MSLYDYHKAMQLIRQDTPIYALIMAAMHKADSNNLAKLKEMWPDVWAEVYMRWNTPRAGCTPEVWERYQRWIDDGDELMYLDERPSVEAEARQDDAEKHARAVADLHAGEGMVP